MKVFIQVISALLIILWIYAALSKLIDFDQSRTEMLEQVFPVAVSELLAWVVPVTELATAALLIVPETRKAGLKISLLMLLLFSLYIMAVLLHVFQRIPCSCGGILEKMTWTEHLAFNAFFLVLTLIALIQTSEERRMMGKG